METTERSYTAFSGERLLASGPVRSVLSETKHYLDGGGLELLLIFEDQTGAQVEFDLQGSVGEVLARLEADPSFAIAPPSSPTVEPPRPGRPKLGVVSREVSLLPRHWEWLERQPGGLSATLRKLVELARKSGRAKELARNAREAAAKFMWAMGGNLPGFEEASRALYAKDDARLRELICDWPADIRAHVLRLLGEAARLDTMADAHESIAPAQSAAAGSSQTI